MAKRTGKDLAIVLGGTTVATGLEWELEDNDVNIETTAAGDAVVDRDSLRYDFTFRGRARLTIASPYVIPSALRGTKATFAGKIIAADTNGIVSGTALFTQFRIQASYDGAVEIGFEAQAAGTALTYNLTPA